MTDALTSNSPALLIQLAPSSSQVPSQWPSNRTAKLTPQGHLPWALPTSIVTWSHYFTYTSVLKKAKVLTNTVSMGLFNSNHWESLKYTTGLGQGYCPHPFPGLPCHWFWCQLCLTVARYVSSKPLLKPGHQRKIQTLPLGFEVMHASVLVTFLAHHLIQPRWLLNFPPKSWIQATSFLPWGLCLLLPVWVSITGRCYTRFISFGHLVRTASSLYSGPFPATEQFLHWGAISLALCLCGDALLHRPDIQDREFYSLTCRPRLRQFIFLWFCDR